MRTSAVLLVFGLCAGLSWSQFLNNKPWPTYSLENMPDTEFSCRDKILGGYYADPQTQCQMFHICVKVAGVGIQDFRFLCPNGTAFDQDHQICADWEDVDCDATTLYYSSDNFDLYRIGSGFESKAVKYGEDEEFSLQRADTGDARLNREHQTQRVNQQFETNNNFNRKTNNNNNNNYNNNNNNNNNNKHRSQQQDDDREIFRGSSSSNFFNNRNNGKENDDDYDDSNVNINQDRDEIQRKKVVKTQHRRPNYRTTEAPRTREPITEAPEQPRQTTTIQPVRRNKSPNIQQRNNNYQQDYEEQTIKPQRPSGFTNNFAGSFPSTTSRPTSTTLTNEQYTKAVNNYRSRNQRVRVQNDRQYNNAENFRQNQNTNQEAHSQTPVYTVSTPAPFRQTQYKTKTANFNHYNSPTATTTTTTTTTRPVVESYTTTLPPKSPSSFSTKNYNQKSSTSSKQTTPFKQTENYPINNPKYNNNFEKKQPLTVKNENYPTTYAPKTKNSEKYNKNKEQENYPTTFAPKANSAYSQTQTTQHKNSQNTQYFNPPVPSQSRKNNQENFNKDPTPKTSPFTRYTPTVPKISSTTPTSRSQGRSSRYDETEYDDGSYDTKFDKEDLNTAHSQNIAASRNEFLKNTKPPQQRTTHKQVQQPKPTPAAAVTKKQNQQKATQPRPFSASPNTPKVTERPKQVATSTIKSLPERPKENKKQEAPKTKKDYDYAYYDSNNEHEYDLQYHTELKKSTANN